ncbi:MAG: peptidyl-prolyl cis-trans isomerase [Planctomycetota bacterium]|nr:peptidyl-prolyl cis-trans isomerase [Planctomycetota bacterium]
MRSSQALAIAACLCFAFAAPAADFSVEGPTLELRRIQFCQRCQASLVVTAIPPGALIQCPRCALVQSRIPTRHLLTKIFQVCPHCGARLLVADFPAGSVVRCGHCRSRQEVLAEAVWKPGEDAGRGFLPDGPVLPPAEIPLPPTDDSSSRSDRGAEQTLPRNEVSLTAPPAAPIPPAAPTPAAPSGPINEVPSKSETAPADSRADKDKAAALAEVEALAACQPPGIIDPAEDEEMAQEVPARAVEESEGILPFGYRPNRTSEISAGAAADPFAADGLWEAAALVNGEPIYAAELEPIIALALEQLRLEMGSKCATPWGVRQLQRCRTEARERALQQCIDRKIMRQEAKRLGIAPRSDEIAEKAARLQEQKGIEVAAHYLWEEAEEEIIAERLLRRYPTSAPTPADVRDYYERHRQEYLQPPRAALRSLTVFLDREGKRDARPALAIARQIVSDLLGGAPFEDLIRHYSEDTAANQQGVMIFRNSPLIPLDFLGTAVREALAEAKEGKVVGPIIVPGAIVFFKLEEWQEAQPLPLAAVAGKIQQTLARQARQEALAKILADLRAQADIRLPRATTNQISVR